MNDVSKDLRRIEPTFGLKTPILFAHRGGVLEAPESTVKAFSHALNNAGAEILEIDVQLTRDGEFVVWHGPELDNVRIEGESHRPIERPKERRKIHGYDWKDLDGKAWVADPYVKEMDEDEIDLSEVPQDEDRFLLRLSTFLQRFKNVPLNIELKKSFKRKINDTDRRGLRDNIRAFSDVLDNDPSKRTIVVVSARDDYIDEFRALSGEKYPTGLSIQEQLVLQFSERGMKNRVLETSYNQHLSSKRLIDKVRNAGGSTFVFLTGFGLLLPPIDEKEDVRNEKEIMEVLDRGVDGIMTDRPKWVRGVIDTWISQLKGK